MINKVLQVLSFNQAPLIPCSEKEIETIEKFCGFTLPLVYRTFLKNMGRHAGSYMAGSMCFYDDLILINEEAALLLKEKNFRKMPLKSFVFWMHQGYQFAFFLDGQGDDPPIYYYNETIKQNDFIQSYKALSEFYYSELELSLQAGMFKNPPFS